MPGNRSRRPTIVRRTPLFKHRLDSVTSARRKRRISADTALRLARYFGTSERFWMNLQGRYDLEVERDRIASALDGIRPLATA